MALLDTLGPARWPATFVSAEGALLWDDRGRTFWDFYGGHAVTLLGQGHPAWVRAVSGQAATLSFVTMACDVPVRNRAADRLCTFTGMDHVFFVNSGAEANEAALKIARKATGRPVVVSMIHGFHGRTMGAVGVTWKYREQHAPAHGDVRFVPFGDLAALKEALGPDVAAVLVEPVQGMAGVVVPPAGWLLEVQAACRAVGALFVCDEVQCGMGRMGVPLVSVAAGCTPDLVTVGKGVAGGFPCAALLLTDAMAKTTKPGEHGTTFGGGPVAMAAVEATLRVIDEEDLLAKSRALGEHMVCTLAMPGVKEVRGGGAWAGIVLDRPAKPVADALYAAGFLVGTSTDPHVLRLAPPAITPAYAVELLADALSEALGNGARVGVAA